MFSENERISGRQLYRSIVLTMAGPTLLVCPRVAAKYGADGFFVYGVAGMLSILYVSLVLWVRGRWGARRWQEASGCNHRGLSWMLVGFSYVLLFAKLLLLAVGGLYLICDVVTGILLPETHILMVLGVVALALIYWHQGSIECSARAFEMLFYWVVVPIVVVVVLAVPIVDVDNLAPRLETGVGEILMAGTFLWFLFTPAELLILCDDHIKYDRKRVKSVWKGVAVLQVGNLITYGAILGIYGESTIGEGSPYPLLKVMQISGVPGDFLRRLDGFMSLFLVLSLFLTMVMLMDYMGISLWEFGRMLFGDRVHKRKNRNKIVFATTIVLFMSIGVVVVREQGIFRQPATGASAVFHDKKIVSGVELEDRAFVMSVIIGEQTVTFEIASEEADMWQEKSQYVTLRCNTVEEAELLYKENGDKRLDFSHLKIIFFEKGLMGEPVTLENLRYMYMQEKYAENVLVCVLEDELAAMAMGAMEKQEALAVVVENTLEKSGKGEGMELYVVYRDSLKEK